MDELDLLTFAKTMLGITLIPEGIFCSQNLPCRVAVMGLPLTQGCATERKSLHLVLFIQSQLREN